MKYVLTITVLVASLCSLSATAANRSDPGYTPAHPRDAGSIPAGGGSCATPVSITSLPFSQAGNSCGGTNNITSYGGPCGDDLPFPYPGPEDVWAITVGTGNSITVQASLTGSTGDLALFFLGTCGDGSSCLFNSQDAVGPGTGPEVLNPNGATPPAAQPLTGLTAGHTYYVYVDSYYGTGSASCGTYTLQVSGVIPVTLESYRID